MTPQTWRLAGAVCLVAAVVFAVLALFEAYNSPVVIMTVPPGTGSFLTALVYGVLAGAAFFSGLACFFWSAMAEARKQRAELVERLTALLDRERNSRPTR